MSKSNEVTPQPASPFVQFAPHRIHGKATGKIVVGLGGIEFTVATEQEAISRSLSILLPEIDKLNELNQSKAQPASPSQPTSCPPCPVCGASGVSTHYVDALGNVHHPTQESLAVDRDYFKASYARKIDQVDALCESHLEANAEIAQLISALRKAKVFVDSTAPTGGLALETKEVIDAVLSRDRP